MTAIRDNNPEVLSNSSTTAAAARQQQQQQQQWLLTWRVAGSYLNALRVEVWGLLLTNSCFCSSARAGSSTDKRLVSGHSVAERCTACAQSTSTADMHTNGRACTNNPALAAHAHKATTKPSCLKAEPETWEVFAIQHAL
jgi:hypothetical protein